MTALLAPPARALLLGCGRNHALRMGPQGRESLPEIVTLDMSPDVGADFVWNLERHPLPFDDESFDELHAYDVLEHLGTQGDWRGYFDEFADYWRILKPGGRFYIAVPIGESAFADPGHTRFFQTNHFRLLSQRAYDESTDITDYRWYWKRDFEVLHLEEIGGCHLLAVLEKR